MHRTRTGGLDDRHRHFQIRPALDGRAALRFGIVLILLWFGYMKFLPYEAEGVAGIARDYWLFGWMYPLIGVAGASIVIGVLEIDGRAS